jgi:hypothetical protein
MKRFVEGLDRGQSTLFPDTQPRPKAVIGSITIPQCSSPLLQQGVAPSKMFGEDLFNRGAAI